MKFTTFLTAMSQMTSAHNSDGGHSNKTTSGEKTVTNINTLQSKILIWNLLFYFISQKLIFHALQIISIKHQRLSNMFYVNDS